jgi:hypothetical protein
VRSGQARAEADAQWQTFSDSGLQAETKRRGETIATALERYRADHGVYPPRLEDLVPAYLTKLERPVAGKMRWSYSISADGGRFWLGFGLGDDGYPGSSYSSDKPGEWYDDS